MQPPARLPIAIAVSASLFWSGCEDKPKAPGQLVVSIETDMALPDQVDTIRVQVLVHGQALLDVPYEVGDGPKAEGIPATLTVLAGKDPFQPVTIRVQGIKRGVARTLREAVTTVPKDRTAHLRMPVQWLCDGSAKTVSRRGDDSVVVSSCGDEATCSAGVCVPNTVKSEMLPVYEATEVFGGGSGPGTGLCFDTLPCMITGIVTTPDADCTIPRPEGGNGVNVALRVAGQGICDATGNSCFVPLDGASDEGFQESEDRLRLPSSVCEKLRQGAVTAVVASTSCITKTAATPPCGSWSSVKVVQLPDAGATMADSPPLPTAPETTLVTALEMGRGGVCCPLLADDRQFYSCLCNGSEVSVMRIDASGARAPSAVTRVTQREVRPRFAATLSAGNFYWTDRRLADAGGLLSNIERTRLEEGSSTSTLAQVDGDIYDESTLLSDERNLYVLADNVRGAQGALVQLLRVEVASGKVSPLDTGSDGPVFQFGQDQEALYLVSYTREGERQLSRIARIDKASGALTFLDEQTLPSTPGAPTGYLGLIAGDDAVYALYQSASKDEFELQLIRIATPGGKRTTVYRERVDPASVSFQLLGVANGFVLMARTQSQSSDGGPLTRAGSSLVAVPTAGGALRVLADFVRDGPVGGVSAPRFDRANLYWLNASGRLYRYPSAGLE